MLKIVAIITIGFFFLNSEVASQTLRAQLCNRSDTNPWLLNRAKNLLDQHPLQNRSFELPARHGWRIGQVGVEWSVYFL